VDLKLFDFIAVEDGPAYSFQPGSNFAQREKLNFGLSLEGRHDGKGNR
jgi:hypothetical protein